MPMENGSAKPTVILTFGFLLVIVMMILPMPAWVLDIGVAFSFAFAILVFALTIFVREPLEFSAFPSVLLGSLMLRLSLNVSSTKLIIGEGHSGIDAAGNVIRGFASFIMNGSVLLGLVVFCVLLIVNFAVITKGAARMAEVGARFALDGMPGRQLAIDSDLSSGAITHEEARSRREREQLEATFFGSLDGASKFVKGDAVAGLLITLLNLVMGLAMGVLVHGMAFSSAFETYAILTVGDGLVSQLPAVIISIAAALLLARGGNKGAADVAVLAQISKHPIALGSVAGLMVIFGLVPGLPFVPFAIGGAVLAVAAYVNHSKAGQANAAAEIGDATNEEPRPNPIGDTLDLDEIHVEFAPDLVNMVLDPGAGLDARITNMRRHMATTFGLIMPEIRLTDNPALSSGTYVIRIQGVEQARAQVRPNNALVLLPDGDARLPVGEDVSEPVYGAPARWISTDQQEKFALSGMTVVSPNEVIATHILEVLRKNLSRLLSLKSLRRLLDELKNLSDPDRAAANRKLFDDLIPDKVPMDILHAVLRLLLDEQVSIRNLPLILEAIAEARMYNARPEAICEHVRQRLGFQLSAALKREDGTIPLIQLAPEWEETFSAYQMDGEGGAPDVALPPDLFSRLTEKVSEQLENAATRGIMPALITSTRRRRFLHTVLSAKGIGSPVLSFEEIGVDTRPALVGTVEI